MPLHTCALCGGPQPWKWEDAFLSYGFDEGEHSETHAVASTLVANGYTTEIATYADNDFIESIVKDDVEQISAHDWPGEMDPRQFLPADLIALLDKAFPAPAPFAVFRVPPPFEIDEQRSTATDLHIPVGDLCTVSISNRETGIHIIVLPSYPNAAPEIAAYFPKADLQQNAEEAAS